MNNEDLIKENILLKEELEKTKLKNAFPNFAINETDCVVCMDKCINKFYICCRCHHKIHNICFAKRVKPICSICKYYIFMYKE